jgi:hypothetical protein
MSEFQSGCDRSICNVVGLLFLLDREGGSVPFAVGLVGGVEKVSVSGDMMAGFMRKICTVGDRRNQNLYNIYVVGLMKLGRQC